MIGKFEAGAVASGGAVRLPKSGRTPHAHLAHPGPHIHGPHTGVQRTARGVKAEGAQVAKESCDQKTETGIL